MGIIARAGVDFGESGIVHSPVTQGKCVGFSDRRPPTLDRTRITMPLTPADIHNVAFKKPPIGKRGYDEEEVDAFLDEVERELARLIEENNELRAQVERGGRGGAPAVSGADPRMAAELNDMKAQLDRIQRDKTAAEQPARQMQAELDHVRAHGPV